MSNLDLQELHVHDMLEALRSSSDYELAAAALDEAVKEFKRLVSQYRALDELVAFSQETGEYDVR